MNGPQPDPHRFPNGTLKLDAGEYALDVIENPTEPGKDRTWSFRIDEGDEFEYMEISEAYDSPGQAWAAGRDECRELGLKRRYIRPDDTEIYTL